MAAHNETTWRVCYPGGLSVITDTAPLEETLAFIAKDSGEGSYIIFNYLFKSVLDGTCNLEEARKSVEYRVKAGEPFSFGIEEGTIDDFLFSRGFYQVKNVTADELKEAYFRGKNRRRKVSHLFALVHATVKPKEEPSPDH